MTVGKTLSPPRPSLIPFALILALAAPTLARDEPPSAESLIPKHVEQLRWLMKSWSSIEIESRTDSKPAHGWKGRPFDFDQSTLRYVATADGKSLEDRLSAREGVSIYRSVDLFDGRESVAFILKGKRFDEIHQVMRGDHSQGDRPSGFSHFWFGPEKVPLDEVLPDAQFLGQRNPHRPRL